MKFIRKTILLLPLLPVALVSGGMYFFETNISAADSAKQFVSLDETGALFFLNAVQKTSCDTAAYLQDNDPNGTNVRSKPDKNSAVLKVLKTSDEVEVHITGSAGNGWFEIDRAGTVGGEQDLTIFEGRGWLHASVLGLSAGSGDPRLYSAPGKKSRIIKKLIPDASPITMLGCSGKWMKVRSGKSIGWMPPEAQCASPLTTCS